MSLNARLEAIRQNLPEHVALCAVSKTKPLALLQEAYNAGQRIFGENRVLEMADKYEVLPKDIQWHMVGHVQTNKVKLMIPFVSLIHAVDSERLFREIDKHAARYDRVVDVLLQVHIAREANKHGFAGHELNVFLDSGTLEACKHVRVRGLMGMATFTDNQAQVRREFATLKQTFDDVKEEWFGSQAHFDTLSMGMSGDYQIAIEEGATLVRIGSSIFGARG